MVTGEKWSYATFILFCLLQSNIVPSVWWYVFQLYLMLFCYLSLAADQHLSTYHYDLLFCLAVIVYTDA